MKQTIKLRESELKRMIAESLKRTLNEWSDDYEGNDLDYESIKMQAEDIIYKMQQQGMPISWRSVAENMGFRLNTLNGEDLELLKDTIEEVMVNDYNTNESIKRTIRRIVSECTKKTLNEGGHLYHKDDDGKVWTNSKDTYRGVPGSTYIWHGEWADPEILWDGVELNANDVEESLWLSYKDECSENGEQPTEDGYENWLEEMGTEYIASELDDLAWAAQGCP